MEPWKDPIYLRGDIGIPETCFLSSNYYAGSSGKLSESRATLQRTAHVFGC